MENINKHSLDKELWENEYMKLLLDTEKVIVYDVSEVRTDQKQVEYINLYLAQAINRNAGVSNNAAISESDSFFMGWGKLTIVRAIRAISCEILEENETIASYCQKGFILEGFNIQCNDLLTPTWTGDNGAKRYKIGERIIYKCYNGNKIYTLKSLVRGKAENTVIISNSNIEDKDFDKLVNLELPFTFFPEETILIKENANI